MTVFKWICLQQPPDNGRTITVSEIAEMWLFRNVFKQNFTATLPMQLGVTSTSTMRISFYHFFLFSSSVSLSSCLVLLSLSFCLFFCFSLFLFSSSVSLSFCLVLRYLSLSVCSSVSLNLIHSLLLSIYFSLSVFRQIFIFFLLLSLSNTQLHTCFIFSIIGTVSLSLSLCVSISSSCFCHNLALSSLNLL